MAGEGGASTVLPWDPVRYLKKVDPFEASISRGFLRSHPERWFPGWSAQWLTLAHSLGCEFSMVDVKPVVSVSAQDKGGWAATVDEDPLFVLVDKESEEVLVEAVVPEAAGKAREVVGEYLARRFLSTLTSQWSGKESSQIRFIGRVDTSALGNGAGVKLVTLINGRQCVIWIQLGQAFVERLDGLWRRQVHSTSKFASGQGAVHLEIAQLAVPPALLVDYMKSGTVIDLEIGMTDTIILRQGSRPWLAARICAVGGRLGFEVLPTLPASAGLPPGTTRVFIEFGQLSADPGLLAEIAQAGAIYDTGFPLSDKVEMVINNERVASATLCSYEGRFAISVS